MVLWLLYIYVATVVWLIKWVCMVVVVDNLAIFKGMFKLSTQAFLPIALFHRQWCFCHIRMGSVLMQSI